MKNNKELVFKIKDMSFEEAILRLEEISEMLSSQKVNLESMMANYEEAQLLKDHCQKRLDEAKMKIDIINKKTNKNYSQ